jgi:hypothetical protein
MSYLRNDTTSRYMKLNIGRLEEEFFYEVKV